MKRALLAAGLAAILAGASAMPAAAYQCKNFSVTGNGSTHVKKPQAEKNAIAAWSQAAKSSYGQAWSVWGIAKAKRVDCRGQLGTNNPPFRCKAKAKPCKYVVF